MVISKFALFEWIIIVSMFNLLIGIGVRVPQIIPFSFVNIFLAYRYSFKNELRSLRLSYALNVVASFSVIIVKINESAYPVGSWLNLWVLPFLWGFGWLPMALAFISTYRVGLWIVEIFLTALNIALCLKVRGMLGKVSNFRTTGLPLLVCGITVLILMFYMPTQRLEADSSTITTSDLNEAGDFMIDRTFRFSTNLISLWLTDYKLNIAVRWENLDNTNITNEAYSNGEPAGNSRHDFSEGISSGADLQALFVTLGNLKLGENEVRVITKINSTGEKIETDYQLNLMHGYVINLDNTKSIILILAIMVATGAYIYKFDRK